MSLKNSLCSKKLITLLNKMGHCISYDEVLCIDAEWVKTLSEKDDSYTIVPTDIASGYFTQAAVDNADYAQENDS